VTTSVRHIIRELGMEISTADDTVRANATVFPETCFPGTTEVRTSVLATWSDVVTGTLAGNFMGNRVPLTLDLELQRLRPLVGVTSMEIIATPVKVGRTVAVTQARFVDTESGDDVAVSFATFIASPDPAHVFPNGFPAPIRETNPRHLAEPLAERAQVRIVEPGTVEMPRRDDGLNATGAIQGGLVALAAEEALLSTGDSPLTVASLNIRYLRPFRVGPARAVASVSGTTGIVHLTDVGSEKLAALVTAHLAPRT
jgi:acyl-coenzyme A thioesterase PaaI-like protein